jgi:methionyl-tRNA formyltransferase
VLAREGAELLVEALNNRVFVPPLNPLKLSPEKVDMITRGQGIAHAPKITPEDRRIDWERMTSAEIQHRSKILTSLWDTTTYQKAFQAENSPIKRVKYSGFIPHFVASNKFPLQDLVALSPGTPFVAYGHNIDSPERKVAIKTVDDFVVIRACTIEGGRKEQGETELINLIESKSKS